MPSISKACSSSKSLLRDRLESKRGPPRPSPLPKRAVTEKLQRWCGDVFETRKKLLGLRRWKWWPKKLDSNEEKDNVVLATANIVAVVRPAIILAYFEVSLNNEKFFLSRKLLLLSSLLLKLEWEQLLRHGLSWSGLGWAKLGLNLKPKIKIYISSCVEPKQ